MRRRFIRNREAVDEYFTIESLEDECIISLTGRAGISGNAGLVVWDSINNSHWTYNNLLENPITLKKGYKVRFKQDATMGTFVITKKCKILGSIMSLCFMDDFKNKTSLGSYTFPELFKGCNTIVYVDKGFLPATTLSESCYWRMFYGCTSLVEAPELPATTLAERCYSSMFFGCTKLNNITMLATDISASGCLSDWVKGVSPTGTFVKHPDAEWDVRGVDGIPEGWTVKFDGEEEGGTKLIENKCTASVNKMDIIKLSFEYPIESDIVLMWQGKAGATETPVEISKGFQSGTFSYLYYTSQDLQSHILSITPSTDTKYHYTW